jgi:hypothetical protein
MVNISTTVRGLYDNYVYLWAIIIRRFCDTGVDVRTGKRKGHEQGVRWCRPAWMRKIERKHERPEARGHLLSRKLIGRVAGKDLSTGLARLLIFRESRPVSYLTCEVVEAQYTNC